MFSDRINKLQLINTALTPHTCTYKQTHRFVCCKTCKVWSLDSRHEQKAWITNLRSLWDIIIHGSRRLSSCFPPHAPRPSKRRENLIRMQTHCGKHVVLVLSSESVLVERRLCSQSRLSFHPACISSADATANWCALVLKREVPLGASWGRTTAQHGARTKPTL